MSGARDRDLVFEAEDGYALHGRLFEPISEARASVVLHGATATPAGFYTAFAQHLAGQGYEVLTYDFRGVGLSRPVSLRGFRATLSQWAQLDAAAAHRLMRARDPARPLVAIGHSFGGQVALTIPDPQPLAAVFFVAAQSGYWGGFDWPARWRMYAVWHAVLPALTSTFGYLPAWAGLGEDLPRGVAEQWARWCLSPDYFLVDHPEFASRLGAYRGPALALSFTDDRLASLAASRWIASSLPRARLEHLHLAPADVGLDAIDHFGFFRRRSAQALWPLATDYLDGVLAGAWSPREDPTRLTEHELVEQLQSRAS